MPCLSAASATPPPLTDGPDWARQRVWGGGGVGAGAAHQRNERVRPRLKPSLCPTCTPTRPLHARGHPGAVALQRRATLWALCRRRRPWTLQAEQTGILGVQGRKTGQS